MDAVMANALLGLFGCKGGDVRGADEGVLPQAAGKSGLILADLPLHRGDRRVNRREHIGRAFPCAEVHIRRMYSNLCNIPVLVDAERYQRLGIIAKEPLQFHDLLFGILVNILREVDFLLGVLKSHTSRSFRFLPLPEDLRFLFLCGILFPKRKVGFHGDYVFRPGDGGLRQAGGAGFGAGGS